MPVIDVPIASGFYESESLPISAQRCVNFYPNIPQSQSLSPENLFGAPGIEQLTTTGDFEHINRGAHVKNGIPYFVNGGNLYSLDRTIDSELNESFSTTSLGAVSGTGRVSMADNGQQLIILVPGGSGYIYDEDAGTPFAEITDPDFTANGTPQYVVYIDGYFAVTTDSKKWIISALNDGTSWSALDFGTAEVDPDLIVAPVVHKNRLYITGSETTEGFDNRPSGASFPFIRSSVFMNKGCSAPFSLVLASDTFMMIGRGVNESPAIWQFTGNNYQKLSTTAIDNKLAEFTDSEIDDAFGFVYGDKGAYFVGWTISDFTIIYDSVSQKWHERESTIDERQRRWRVNSLVSAYGRILVGDNHDGRIGQLTSDVYTEYGSVISSYITTPPLSRQGEYIKVKSAEATVESGVGNSAVVDPQISLSVSRDGKTFDYERQRSMGEIGKYNQRAIWFNIGRFPRFAVFKLSISDPVKKVLIGFRLRATQ